jgi:selenocysteine lyase/cysteine desulfurase
VDKDTGVVALTMASNGFGSIVPLGEIIPRIRSMAPECMVCVDAVHHALHGTIDVAEIDCDFLAFSGYKVFGPMIGVLWGREGLLNRIAPYRVETNKDEAPGKFEQGTLNNAAIASLEAALNYLLWLYDEIQEQPGKNRMQRGEKFTLVMDAISDYERALTHHILSAFEKWQDTGFLCHGIVDPGKSALRDPTFAFEISSHTPDRIKSHLWDKYSVQIADGNHYSAAVYRHLGRGSLCRASFAHYDSLETAGIFLRAIEDLL